MAERLETADAAGVVGDGAVADSTVVVGGTSVEDGSRVERPNTFDKRLANIPIMDITPVAASRQLLLLYSVQRAWEPTRGSHFLYYGKYGIYGLCGNNMDTNQRRIAREEPRWPLFHIQKPRP